MRPGVVTALSARPWEERLALVARHTAAIRLLGRIYEPIELRSLPTPDWVIVGAETAWLDAPWVGHCHANGTSVLGVHAGPAEAAILERCGVDVAAHVDTDPIALLQRTLAPPIGATRPEADVVAVVGPPGAGATTVAIALSGPGTALVDTDAIPGVGPALGMPPPGMVSLGERVVPGHRDRGGPFVVTAGGDPSPVSLIGTLAAHHPTVIVDCTPPLVARLGWFATEVLLVVDASVQGLLRGLAMVDDWSWPPPTLVLNRVVDSDDAVEAARSALGLDPDACVPLSVEPLAAARAALAQASSGRAAAR